MIKVTITLILLACSVVQTTHGSSRPMEESREAEIMRKLDDLKVADRDVDTWFAEYEAEMANYTAMTTVNGTDTIDEDMLCDNPDTLMASLDTVRDKISLVEYGINKTMKQLDEVEALVLDHAEYHNVTGLKEKLSVHLEAHRNDSLADQAKLDAEKLVIVTKEAQINTYNCPCVWGEWAPWTDCPVTCGGGDNSRSRVIARNATNSGTECDGSNNEDGRCNEDHCPINCEWSEWEEWNMTPAGCSTECGVGNRTRARSRTPPEGSDLYGGICTGDPTMTKQCNVLDEAQAELQTQTTTISDIKEQICSFNCTSTRNDCQTVLPATCS